MSTAAAQISSLGNQVVIPRSLARVRSLKHRQIIPAVLLFIALAAQLWVRITIIEKGYSLEKLRETALENDIRLRQLRLDYAYLTRPMVLTERAKKELRMESLVPQRIRRMVVQVEDSQVTGGFR